MQRKLRSSDLFAGMAALVAVAAIVCAANATELAPAAFVRPTGSAGSTARLPGLTRVIMPRLTQPEPDRAAIDATPARITNPHVRRADPADRKAIASGEPLSIVELARALRNDVDLIYEYVRNNVDYYPVWGVQKGALGALIDQQGTAFDQAMLMVALLRQAGYTATVVRGRISLTGAQVGAWLGVAPTNACAIRDVFDAGRIFVAEVTSATGGCTPLDGIAQIDHVWVKVRIGSTDYHFDPSYKAHSIKGGIGLAAAAGYNASSYVSSAKAGAVTTNDYIESINRTNIRSNLTTLASNLATHVRTNLPAGQLDDLIGGARISPYEGPALRQTELPYRNIAFPLTEYQDIPDSFKPTLRIQYAGIDATFTSDALQGARVTITYDGNNRAVLSVDDVTVGISASPLAPGTRGPVAFEIRHNAYGATPADHDFSQSITAGGTYLIGSAWGPASRGAVTYHAKVLVDAVAAGGNSSTTVDAASLAVLSSTWLAQSNKTFRMIERLGNSVTTFHHQVGIAGHDKGAYVDLPGNLVSVTSLARDTAAEDAVFFSQGMHGSSLESSVVEQQTNISALSTVKLIDLAAANGFRIYDATSANYAGVVQPGLSGCSPSQIGQFQARVNAANRLILPSHCDLKENAWTGNGYFVISSDLSSVGSLIDGDLAGGFSSQPQPLTMMVDTEQTVAQYNIDIKENRGVTTPEPIDLATGAYLYERNDITAGAGEYPQSLALRRMYTSLARSTRGPLGNGWSHNFATDLKVISDGLQSLGEDSALDAVATVVEMMIAHDLLLDPAKPLDKMVIATIGQQWFGDQLIRNLVSVRQGSRADVFAKLSDGSYNAPPASSRKLIANGDGTFSVESVNRDRLDFNLAGKAVAHVHPNGMQVSYLYSGSNLTEVRNSFGRKLAFTYVGDTITSVSDGTRSITYGYDHANLALVFDATSQATGFVYDAQSRIKNIYYPSTPLSPFVTNVYDGFDRVQTQTDANGREWRYFFAGSRNEEVAPNDSSRVTYHDVSGNITRSIDAAGRVISMVYDGQGRVVRTTQPEGNGYEFEYDDATCFSQLRCTHNVKTIRAVPKPGSGLANLVTTRTYESAFNRAATITDARGKIANFTYTANGEPLQILRAADSQGVRPQVDFGYSTFTPSNGLPPFTMMTRASVLVAAGDGVDTTFAYDTAARNFVPLSRTLDAGTGKLNLTTAYGYDALGNLTAIDGPRTDVADATNMAYDAERRVTQVADALGRLFRRFYDADGRVTREALQSGAEWLVTCRAYTPTGKVSSVWGPAVTGSDTSCPNASAPVSATDFAYDDLDRLLRTTQKLGPGEGGNRVTERVYAIDGRIASVQAGVGDALAQVEAAMTYTTNGEVASVTDARNNRTSYAYDGFDRRNRTFFPDKTAAGTSSATDFEQYAYDEHGNVTSLRTRSGQSISVTYDSLNRPISRTYPDAADNVTYGYDLVGHPLFSNNAGGSHNITYTWDHRDRLTSTTAGSRTLVHQYDAAGNRTRTTWPESIPFVVTTDYDALSRPTIIKEQGTTPLATYAYDDLSRRATVTLGNGTSTSYAYNPQGSLASIAHDFAGTSSDVTFAYARNAAREIVTATSSNPLYEWDGAVGGTVGYAVNGLDQYTTVDNLTQTYDSSGNLASGSGWTYAYDADNRLRSVGGRITAALAWDAESRLRQTTINGSTTQLLYDGVRLVGEYDGSGALLRRYVHGPGVDEPLVRYEGAGTTQRSWYYANHQGSIVAVADGAGNVTSRHTYGPFGEPGVTAPPRFGYTGQQFLPALGLAHYRARMYSPSLGRFLQPDPMGQRAGPNLYTYVGNDPVNHFDPSGLWTVQIGFATSGVAGWGPFQLSGLQGYGVAIDDSFNVGVYHYVGGGGGGGLAAGIHQLSVQFSNAQDIFDLSGKFENTSATAGSVLSVSVDGFQGPSTHGWVNGFGFTGGAGGGAGLLWANTWTDICGTWNHYRSVRCEGEVIDFLKALPNAVNAVVQELKKEGWWK